MSTSKGLVRKALVDLLATGQEWRLVRIALVAAAGVVAAYMIIFAGDDLGSTADWGSFGDYFGGLVNPIVGLVTVILVVRTLEATQREAKLTRDQLAQQTDHMRSEREAAARASHLAELQKRIDGAYAEWLRANDQLLGNITRPMRDTAERYYVDSSFPTVGSALHDVDFAQEVSQAILSSRRNAYRADWIFKFHPSAKLAEEIALYCSEYESAAGDSILADFYRRRVERPATVLHRMGWVNDWAMRQLTAPNLSFPAAPAE